MNLMRFVNCLLAVVGALMLVPAFAQSSAQPTSADLAGDWTVTQNSKPSDTLRGISLQPNGDALLRHSTMSFKRQWKFSGGVLTILPAKDEFAPGPPDYYKVLAFDTTKKQIDIRNDLLKRDIRLVKSQ